MDIMNNKDMVVMVAGYGDLLSARRDFADLNDNIKKGRFEVRDAVLVAKEVDGTPTAIDTTNRHGLAGAGFGAGIGLLFGLIAPPLFATVAIGAAAGALTAKLADHSLKSGLRREVGQALEAGTGVVIALYRDASQSSVERVLAGSATKSIVTFAESTIASLEKEVAEVMDTVNPVIAAQPEPQSIP